MDDRGWSDIAYQIAVDQSGRAWTLRGLRTQSGANGNNDLNERYGAILLVLVTGEQPSSAMKATVRGVIADFRRAFPRGLAIRPHSAVRPDGTDCPGPAARAALARGDFTPNSNPEDEMTPAQMQELKNFIEQRVKAYSDRNAVNLRQQLVAVKSALARIEAEVDGVAPTEPTDPTEPEIPDVPPPAEDPGQPAEPGDPADPAVPTRLTRAGPGGPGGPAAANELTPAPTSSRYYAEPQPRRRPVGAAARYGPARCGACSLYAARWLRLVRLRLGGQPPVVTPAAGVAEYRGVRERFRKLLVLNLTLELSREVSFP